MYLHPLNYPSSVHPSPCIPSNPTLFPHIPPTLPSSHPILSKPHSSMTVRYLVKARTQVCPSMSKAMPCPSLSCTCACFSHICAIASTRMCWLLGAGVLAHARHMDGLTHIQKAGGTCVAELRSVGSASIAVLATWASLVSWVS